MTARELAAFHAGVRHAAEAALFAALSLELRDDAGELRQQVASAALRALSEGLKAESSPDAGTLAMVARIAQDHASEGDEACPECAGRIRWAKDALNGHIHARCEAFGCFAVMQ